MCHTYCWELDSGSLATYLREIVAWMNRNPHEVVTLLLTNGDGIPVHEYDAVFESTGLKKYVFHPAGRRRMSKTEWPTLGQLIDAKTRLVVFMDYFTDRGRVDYIISQFDHYWETPYGITDENFPTCSVDRPLFGNPQRLMGIMNHMLNFRIGDIVFPDQMDAQTTNSLDSITKQVNLCESQGKPQPNVILVALLAPATTFADDANPPGQSTFISPDNHVAFAFTVPQTDDFKYPEATFFSIRVPNRYSWGAVGLGSDDMKGALYLIIYQSDDGTNVTFSPRVAYDNSEPTYWPDMQYIVVQNSTGIFGDYMYFTAMCTSQCRSWNRRDTNGGWLDVSSPKQKAIYAVGPSEPLLSNSQEVPLKFHQEFGVFSIDMGRTRGAADAPVLNKDSQNEGTEFVYRQTGKSDYKATLHGTFMIFFIVGMMNFGVVLLRACGWAKWHALNQCIATLGVLSGLALGILTSFLYNRSRAFTSSHQILGFIIVAFILAQLGLGVKHHFEYSKTRTTTLFGRIHVWIGRVILFLALVNSFTGFALAQNKFFSLVLAGLILVACGILATFILGRKHLFPKDTQFQPVGAQQPPPWRQTSHDGGHPSDSPPVYEPPSQRLDLQAAGSSSNPNTPWRSADSKDVDEAHLGSTAKPREFA
ncbi:hypothetical protein E4U53_008112 [Claviceps sorghi]|nr:hypothetical protein E4U53_008112 [Claviceps sorghi]